MDTAVWGPNDYMPLWPLSIVACIVAHGSSRRIHSQSCTQALSSGLQGEDNGRPEASLACTVKITQEPRRAVFSSDLLQTG